MDIQWALSRPGGNPGQKLPFSPWGEIKRKKEEVRRVTKKVYTEKKEISY